MEALPFLPFLSIPIKQAPDDFTPNIISELRVSLARSGRNPDDYHAQLCIFERHRKDVLSILTSRTAHSVIEQPELDLIEAFAGQINSIHKRFGDLFFEGNAWRNADSKAKKVHDDSCWFEESGVATACWNVAALSSELAIHKMNQSMAEYNESDDLIKDACSLLQRTAGILNFILQKTVSPPSPDLTSENIRMMQLLMLQQAQEIIVTKSLRDSKKTSTVAKLAWQCAQYCEELQDACDVNDFAKNDQKDLLALARIKADFFKSLAYFSLGCNSRDGQAYGEAVTYFRQAKDLFTQECAFKSVGSGYDAPCAGAFLYAQDVIHGSLASIEKDNEFIYHDLVKDTVPDPEPHNIVKCAEWEPEITAENELFKSLVPDDALIAASNYTEKTDQLWRDISDEIEAKNIELKKCKDGLEASGISTEEVISRDTLPEELISSIACSDETNDLITKMNASIDELQVKETDFEEQLDSALKMIETDAKATKKCPPNVQGTLADPGWAALTRRIEEIKKAFIDSKEPTQMIVSAAKVSIQNMEILTQGMDHVKSQLPERKVLNEEETEAVNLVTKLVSKIAEMVNQRTNLADQLRAALATDDITVKLAGEPTTSHASIYEKELTKHNATVGYLRKNLAAQEQILSVLNEARLNNAHFYKRQREENQLYDDKINQLVLAAESSKSIAEKLNRGCSFLVNLAAELTKISSVLESALSSRTKMRAKMAPPAPERASKPKPKKNSGLTDEMMKELEELGMADDPEFIQFLINGGGGADISPVSHSLPTKLPGVQSPKIGINRPLAPIQTRPSVPIPNQPIPLRPQVPMMRPKMPPNTSKSNIPTQQPQFHPPTSPTQYQPPFPTPPPTGQIAKNIHPLQRPKQHTLQAPTSPPINGQMQHPLQQPTQIPASQFPTQTPNSLPISLQNGQMQHPIQRPTQTFSQPPTEIPTNVPTTVSSNQVNDQLEAEFKRQQAVLEQERLKLKSEQENILSQRAEAEQTRLAQQQKFQYQQNQMMEQLVQERLKLEQQQKQFEQEKIMQQKQYEQQQAVLKQQYTQPVPRPTGQSLVRSSTPAVQQPILPSHRLITQSTSAQQQPKMTTNIQRPQITNQNYTQMFNKVAPVMGQQSSTHNWLSQYRKPTGPQTPTQIRPNVQIPSNGQTRPRGQVHVNGHIRQPVYTNQIIRTNTPPTIVRAPPPQSVPPSQTVQQPMAQPNLPPPLKPRVDPATQPENEIKPPEPVAKPKLSNFDLLSSLCDEPAQPASLSSEPIQVKQITNEDLISTLANMKPQSNSITHQINQNALHALQQLELHDEMANGLQTTAAAKMSLTQNRQQMILPFDMNRVVLQNRQNDYINCSRINTGSNAVPTALVGEVPLDPHALWSMIWAEKLEILTVVFSREEGANPSLLNFVQIGQTTVFDTNLSVTCKLNQNFDDLSIYQIKLERNKEQRCLTMFKIANYSLHAEPNLVSLCKSIKHLNCRFLQQKSNRVPPLFMSVSGGQRLGAILFGLIVSIELLNSNFASAQMGPIYTQMMSQRQFFLSKRHTSTVIRAIQNFNTC